MSTYLLINIAIIIFPLILSFLPSYRSFYHHWRQLLGSILLVGFIYILWDILVTSQGHWNFNPAHVLGPKLFHLPIEEWLFFITVPFSCLFLYQALKNHFQGRLLKQNVLFLFSLYAAISLFAAVLLYPLAYTQIVLGFTALTTIFVLIFLPGLFRQLAFWVYSALSLGLFVLFNSLLTAIPVVIYNPEVILNLHLGTIPIEDFFYNWTLLTLYAGVYDMIGKNAHDKKN
jgi:lycopene cyclase domain-containing protein